MRYQLQVNDWGQWVVEKAFEAIILATAHARREYPQNEWKVIDLNTQRVVHEYNPSEAIASMARADIDRLDSLNRWNTDPEYRRQQIAQNETRRRRFDQFRARVVAEEDRRERREKKRKKKKELVKVNWLKEGF